MNSSDCPDKATLLAVIAGTASAEQLRAVTQHLDNCAVCRTWWDTELKDRGRALHLSSLRVSPETPLGDAYYEAVRRIESLEQHPPASHALAPLPATVAPTGLAAHPVADVDQNRAIRSFGRYDILRRIGQGGMGVVYLAQDPHLRRLVAIKFLKPQLASTMEGRRRFAREARAAAAIHHPQIVTVFDVEEHDGETALIMEYVGGVSLAEQLQEGPLTIAESVSIVRQIAAGLAAAHAGGVIHRDIKPSNILLEENGRAVRITDFGLARVVDDARLTGSGDVLGTPEFISPEQALGKTIDARTDLFSLGTILYRLCTGRLPFSGTTSWEVLQAIISRPPLPAGKLTPNLPNWLASILEKLLAKQPEDRFQSAAELIEAIDVGESAKTPAQPLTPPPLHPEFRVSAPLRNTAELSLGLSARPAVEVSSPTASIVAPPLATDFNSGQARQPAISPKASQRHQVAVLVAEACVCMCFLLLVGLLFAFFRPQPSNDDSSHVGNLFSDTPTTEKALSPVDVKATNEAAAGEVVAKERLTSVPAGGRLADGSQLDEEWPQSYETVDWGFPLSVEKAETLGSGTEEFDASALAIDIQARRLYTLNKNAIHRTTLDGQQLEILKEHLQHPFELYLDASQGTLYWIATDREFGRVVQRMNVDGGGFESHIARVDETKTVAFDSAELLLREHRPVGDRLLVPFLLKATWNAKKLDVLYSDRPEISFCSWGQIIDGFFYYSDKNGRWLGSDNVYRAALDGSGITKLGTFFGGAPFFRAAVDLNGSVYIATQHSIDRLDPHSGLSQPVVVGLYHDRDVVLDPIDNRIYWTDGSPRRVRRLQLPNPVTKMLTAPPRIVTIIPEQAGANDIIRLRGQFLAGISDVRFLDDDDGKSTAAEYREVSDSELEVTVPLLSPNCRQPLVVVQTAGGVTVTLEPGIETLSGGRPGMRVQKIDRVGRAPGFAILLKDSVHVNDLQQQSAYVTRDCSVSCRGDGGNTLFLKNGSACYLSDTESSRVYHEPYTKILQSAKGARAEGLVAVPAIRGSVVAKLLRYARVADARDAEVGEDDGINPK